MFNVSCLVLVDHEAKIDNTRHECPEAWMFQTYGVMFEVRTIKDACLMFNVSCLMLVNHEAKIDKH